MFRDKIFPIFFLVSIAAHAVILLQNPGLLTFNKNASGPKQIEVRYMKTPVKNTFVVKELEHKPEPLAALPKKITLEKGFVAPFQEKANPAESLKNNLDLLPDRPLPDAVKPSLIKLDTISIKKKITLPQIDSSEKINSPSYINYFQLVREKIRRAAYHNYSGTDTGEVRISFVIGNDGVLRAMHLQDDQPTANSYLTRVALKSVRDSGPFPSFPKELNYPELSFNVAISFGIE